MASDAPDPRETAGSDLAVVRRFFDLLGQKNIEADETSWL